MKRPIFVVAALVSVLTGTGCVGPRVAFRDVRCIPLQAGGRLDAMGFVGSFEARGLDGEQIVYRVTIKDSRGRPVRSRDPSYRDSRGYVSAGRALLVAPGMKEFPNARLTIPARQLELREEDLPAFAEFEVVTTKGDSLARKAAMLPIRGMEQLLPPMEGGSTGPPAGAEPTTERRRDPARVVSGTAEGRDGTQSAWGFRRPARSNTDSSSPSRSVPAPAPAPAEEAVSAREETPRLVPITDPAPSAEVSSPTEVPAPAGSVGESSRPTSDNLRHVIRAGETLSRIALDYYGDERLWHVIWSANPGLNPRRLQIGDEIVIPRLSRPRP